MNTFKIVIINIVFAFGFAAHAQSMAESLLTRDLMTSAKILTSEKHIYNYFGLRQVHPSFGSEQGRHEYINRYIAARSGDFWSDDFTNTSTTNFAAGAGLYFAIDPLISQTYGDTFVQMTMPVGTRFFNVVSPIRLKKDTLAALVSEGFVTQAQIPILFPKALGFYRDTLRMMVDPQFKPFRKMVQHLFSVNQIKFVEYNFNTSLGNFCPGHSYSAFVYVGEENPNDPKNAIVPPPFNAAMMLSTALDFGNISPGEQAVKNETVKFRTTLEQIKGLNTAAAKQLISTVYNPAEYSAVKQATFSCN